MQKVLFLTNLANKIGSFSLASIEAANRQKMSFYMAANWQATEKETIRSYEQMHNIKIYSLPISRNPFAKSNWAAYKQLVDLIRSEQIDCIHCNTPTGGILGRLAGKKCKVKKVVYQAHGFHFYKGAPKSNWLIYYPIEKWLARYTDALITINREDFELAKEKFKLRKNGKVYYVPGVGIDTTQYCRSETIREAKRQELGLAGGDIALISMGDLIPRKNYATAIRAIAASGNPSLQYFICGKGPEKENLQALAQSLNVAEQIHFLDFRSDIKELLMAADIFLFTTKQEGLARSMMEAMASGLPCIASKIRGNTDLIADHEGGFLCNPTDWEGFAEKLKLLASDSALRQTMGKNNLMNVQKFRNEIVAEEMHKIYEAEFDAG